MTRHELLKEQADAAIAEQERALELRIAGALAYVADDPACPDVMRLAALAEELGEVARCLHDQTGNLKGELIQLAGVALAWAVAVDQGALPRQASLLAEVVS